MKFTDSERRELLLLKGVGSVVVQRFEEIGIGTFEELRQYDAAEIANIVAAMLNTTCWKNSPQAIAAITAAITLAKDSEGKGQ